MLVAPGLMVLIPHDGTRQSADRLRRWYAEKVKPVAAAWSIEYGRHGTGYHLNIIADLIGDIAPPGARVLKAPIRTTIRATAAYITKREQAPPATDDKRRRNDSRGNIHPFLSCCSSRWNTNALGCTYCLTYVSQKNDKETIQTAFI